MNASIVRRPRRSDEETLGTWPVTLALPRVGDKIILSTLVRPEPTVPTPIAPPRPQQSGGAIAGHVAFQEHYTQPLPEAPPQPYAVSESHRVAFVEYAYDIPTGAVTGITIVVELDWEWDGS